MNAKITSLVASLEEQISKLRAHISTLESRQRDLQTSKDRLTSVLDEFIRVQGLSDLLYCTQNPLKVVESLADALRKFIEYECLGIFLFDESGQAIQPLGSSAAALIQAAQSQFEEGIFDWVISERRPVIVPWMESFGENVEQPEKNLIIIPLLVGDHPLGAVLLSVSRRTDEFTAQELRVLYFVVSHAAVAIQNALRTRELTHTKDFLFNLLENAGEIIFALDLQGRFAYLNPRIEELGFRKEELEQQPFQTLFKQVEIGDRILSTLARGSRQIFDLEMRTRLARHQHFTISLTAIKNEKGEKIGALGIMRNVTEASRQQKKLLESERLAAYTQTVITLNHEINNPLTAVLGNLFLLDKEAHKAGDERLLERLKVIQDNCQRIQSVIKKLERINELKTVAYLGSTKMVDLGGTADENKP